MYRWVCIFCKFWINLVSGCAVLARCVVYYLNSALGLRLSRYRGVKGKAEENHCGWGRVCVSRENSSKKKKIRTGETATVVKVFADGMSLYYPMLTVCRTLPPVLYNMSA